MKTGKVKNLASLKNKLKKTLPEKIMKVIESYEEFSSSEVPEDAKGFTAHHSACKSAVSHAETLLKLAEWTTHEEEKSKTESEILELIKEAREEKERPDSNEN